MSNVETVDVTPTWAGLLPALLMVLDNPKASRESRQIIAEELARMADAADKYNAIARGES